MLLIKGRISPPPPPQKYDFMCITGSVRFERNCGKMNSRHLFPFGGPRWALKTITQFGQESNELKDSCGCGKMTSSCKYPIVRPSLNIISFVIFLTKLWMDVSNVNDARAFVSLATWVERVTTWRQIVATRIDAHVDVANFFKKVTSQLGERIDILYSLQSSSNFV